MFKKNKLSCMFLLVTIILALLLSSCSTETTQESDKTQASEETKVIEETQTPEESTAKTYEQFIHVSTQKENPEPEVFDGVSLSCFEFDIPSKIPVEDKSITISAKVAIDNVIVNDTDKVVLRVYTDSYGTQEETVLYTFDNDDIRNKVFGYVLKDDGYVNYKSSVLFDIPTEVFRNTSGSISIAIRQTPHPSILDHAGFAFKYEVRDGYIYLIEY